MQISVSSTLTLFHDGQFWVGVVEHIDDGNLSVARIVFGTEPSDEEVLRFVVEKWRYLEFVGSTEPHIPSVPKNPKRRKREAVKELSKRGVSTRSQTALSEAREAQKSESRSQRSQAKRAAQVERFEKRMAKKKEKRKGH